jgi:hypothetical protein
LEGQFVYAWSGTELVLLPCGCEEYQKAVENTERQKLSVSAKELKPGISYTTKIGEEVIYLGRFNWYTWLYRSVRTHKKYHIFAHAKKPQYGQQFFPKQGCGFLSHANSPDSILNFAELMEGFRGIINSSSIRWETKPIQPKIEYKNTPDFSPRLARTEYAQPCGENFDWYTLDYVRQYNHADQRYELTGYTLIKQGTLQTDPPQRLPNNIAYYSPKVLAEEQVLERMKNFVDVFAVLENGKKLKMKGFYGFEN